MTAKHCYTQTEKNSSVVFWLYHMIQTLSYDTDLANRFGLMLEQKKIFCSLYISLLTTAWYDVQLDILAAYILDWLFQNLNWTFTANLTFLSLLQRSSVQKSSFCPSALVRSGQLIAFSITKICGNHYQNSENWKTTLNSFIGTSIQAHWLRASINKPRYKYAGEGK